MTKPQPKDTQGDKGRYENNVQVVQWIFSVYTSANDKYMETHLVHWISSEIKLRRSHHTGHNPKPYAGAYYIIRTNKGKGNINENPDNMLSAWTGEQSCGIRGSKLSSQCPQLNSNMLLWRMLQRRQSGSEYFYGTFCALWWNWWCYIVTTNLLLLSQRMISTMLAWNTLTSNTTSFQNKLAGR